MSIFHCPFIKESVNSQNRKMSWLCKWCVVNVLAEALITGDSACVENEVGWYCHLLFLDSLFTPQAWVNTFGLSVSPARQQRPQDLNVFSPRCQNSDGSIQVEQETLPTYLQQGEFRGTHPGLLKWVWEVSEPYPLQGHYQEVLHEPTGTSLKNAYSHFARGQFLHRSM